MNGAGGQFDTSQMLYEMLNNSGYAPPTKDEHPIGKVSNTSTPITTPEKASTIANSFGDGLWSTTNRNPMQPNSDNRTIRIQQIDFGPALGVEMEPSKTQAKVIEEWEIINPIITNISWGDLDYGSDDLVECTLDIKYDWAEYNKGGGQPLTGFKFEQFSR
jgi:hypothetical protein